MRRLLNRLISTRLAGLALAALFGFAPMSGVLAQGTAALAASAANGPPPGFVAPPEPKADETNAQRAKSQPGNNAPFWRGVRESGIEKGTSNLPGTDKGVLIQEFTQYPGSRLTNAGEAWRQVRNQWIIPYGGALFLITRPVFWLWPPIGPLAK